MKTWNGAGSASMEDGGWPIPWEAPGPAAQSEWRGTWTLEALSALAAHGQAEVPR